MNNTFQDIDGLGYSGPALGTSPDGLGLSVRHLGEGDQVVSNVNSGLSKTLIAVHAVASIAGATIGAYHGYRRNDSIGWAIGWSLIGSLVPYIVLPVAFAQGLGERKRRR